MTTTVEINEARSRFDELIERTGRGEHFVVTKDDKEIARIEPPENEQTAAKPGGFLERARAFRATLPDDPAPIKDYLAEARTIRAKQKFDPTPIKDDIEFGRL